jgi:hypothetical protein
MPLLLYLEPQILTVERASLLWRHRLKLALRLGWRCIQRRCHHHTPRLGWGQRALVWVGLPDAVLSVPSDPGRLSGGTAPSSELSAVWPCVYGSEFTAGLIDDVDGESGRRGDGLVGAIEVGTGIEAMSRNLLRSSASTLSRPRHLPQADRR